MKIMRECFNPAVGSDSLIGEYLVEGFRDGRDQGINGYLVHNVPEYADQYNYIVARYIPDKDEFWFWGAWKDEKPALEAARDIDGQVIYRNGYNNDHNIANDYPSEETDECLKEDTVKQGKKWVNKGEDGTHGKFNTKKEADAQRKAMFANGYKEGLKEESILGVDKKYKDANGAVDYSKLLPADVLAIWNKVIDYAKKNGIELEGMNFTNYADQKACIDAVCTEEEKNKLREVIGNDGEVYSAYESLKEAKKEDEEEFDETAEAQTVKDFVDTFKDYDKDLALEFKPIIIDDKEYNITGIITDDSEEGKITVEIQYVAPEAEEETTDEAKDIETEENDEWEDEDELTEYLVKGLQEHINDRPDPIEDKSKFKGQDNAVVDCPVSKLIAHSEDEKPLDCEMKKEPLPKNLTTK